MIPENHFETASHIGVFRCVMNNQYGRSVGIRTRGLLDPNQARYQTSPHPDSHIIIEGKFGSVKSKLSCVTTI